MLKEHARPTLEDVARESGISRTTIYKVINNKGVVSDKTRRRVEEALERHRYVSNKNARNLAMNRRHRMAFIFFESSRAAYFSAEVRLGIERAVREYGDDGLAVAVSSVSDVRPERQAAAVKKAYAGGVRSFAVAAADPASMLPCLRWLAARDCAVVLVSKDVPGAERNAFIGIDERQCGRLAAELMAKMLRPGDAARVLRSGDDTFSGRERFAGFLGEMARHPGIELRPPVSVPSSGAGLVRAVRTLLADPGVRGVMDLSYKLDLVAAVVREYDRRDLRLVGVDLSPGVVPFLEDGVVDAVIYQNIRHQAYLACRVLFEEMCYGAAIVAQPPVKLEIVMKHNLPSDRGRGALGTLA